MSIRAIAERTILLNITSMDDRGGYTTIEPARNGDNEVRETEGVKAKPTPTAASPMVLDGSTRIARPDGDGARCRNRPGNNATRKECPPSRQENNCNKLGSGSGSGDQDINQPEDGADPAAKKRKTRRGKPKHRKLKPYSKQQMTYDQRLRCRAIGRLTKNGGQPPAPYNTTQFLMEDHSDLPNLEQKLAEAISSEVPPSFQKPLAPPRTRDSSFSIDSDEDYFYSSPEDEEEFLTKEFSSAYEDLHAERLNTMSKTELIQEYVQLEGKLDLMAKRLRGKSIQQIEDIDPDGKNGSSASPTNDAEIAKKLKICQQRIDDLIQQNEQLRRDNEALRAKNCSSPVSSVDSESDSDSASSNGDRSSRSDSTESKSYRSRREQDRRRNERSSSVNRDNSDSASTASSNENASPSESPKSRSDDLVNGDATSHEICGLPT